MNFPYSNILDCHISEVKGGKAIKEFSLWSWLKLNPKVAQKVIPYGDRGLIFNNNSLGYLDFCHTNSIKYWPSKKSYLVSFRNLDLVILLSSDLQKVSNYFYLPGARQHYAHPVDSSTFSIFSNNTSTGNSSFVTFKNVKETWQKNEVKFPVKVPYCGNAQLLTENYLFLGGGCSNFMPDVISQIYKIGTMGALRLIHQTKVMNTSGTYRVELF